MEALASRVGKEISDNGAKNLNLTLPEHDLSNLIGDGYSYDGGSNNVTDISELARIEIGAVGMVILVIKNEKNNG